MSEPKRYTITAALPYANGPLHIGHLAGAYISADIYARHLRLQGKDVIFVCGSDEHGAAITIKARKEGTTPREIIDKYHTIIRDSFRQFGISFDIYHRTSESIHYETSQDIFRKLNELGAFEIQETEQYFDEEAQQFLADRYITGTCPKCNNPGAYGDQCEKCGSTLSPTDLINPTSTLSGSKPVMKKTRHWFLKLDEFQEDIKAWIQSKKDFWKPNVYGQCMSWLNDGLKPRAMTRDLDWGIPVPPEVEGAEGKVLYVWLDAPIGYISATRQLFKEAEEGKLSFSTPQRDLSGSKADDWKKYWQDEDTRLVHFIGKDNIVFHCITFPAILRKHGNYIRPWNVPANEFMNLEGDKISTSRNWAVWLHEYLEAFPDKVDELRYVLIANMPEQKDSEFTWQDFQNRVNSELVGNLGNFVNRVAVLINKFYNGQMDEISWSALGKNDREIIHAAMEFNRQTGASIASFRFRDALDAVMKLSSSGNKYLADNEPWKLIKTDPERTQQVMFTALQIAAWLSVATEPLLPVTAHKIKTMFGINAVPDITEEGIVLKHLTGIADAGLLFQKIEDSLVAEQIAKLQSSRTPAGPTYAPMKETITYEDFSKLDLRTGIITAAEKVEKADKLLKLTVDLGFEQRTIVSGIAEFFSPEEIVGKKVSVVANLAPRKLRGIESQGMILMAEDAEGKLTFVTAEMAPGMVIR
jgi:methionyl-tRNA synthetase